MKKLFTTLSVLLIAAATMAQVPSYVPTNGLVGYWPFNGNANDESGNGNNCTVNGAILTTDRFGDTDSAYEFDGNDVIDCQEGFDLQERTTNIWVLWSSSNWTWSLAFDNDFNSMNYGLVQFATVPNQSQTIAMQQGSNAATSQIVEQQWYMLSVTRSASSVKFYLNGNLVSTETPTNNSTTWSNFFGFRLGGRIDNTKYWVGKIDDLGIWNRPLTEQEIADLYTGCTNPITATITPNGSTTFCAGGFVQLTASTGDSYLWSNGETTQTITATQAGQYTVTVTNNDGCSDVSDPVTVTVNPTPNSGVTVGGATTFCSGGSVTLTSQASSGSYLWSNGETTQSITVDQTGNYSVTVTENGCSATSGTTAVTVNQTPTATITPQGSTTFCDGGFVVLEASGGGTYQWNTGSQASSINVSQSGTYTVIVSDNGCTDQTSQLVTVNPLPTVTLAPFSSLCENGAVVQLSGGSPSGGYYTVNGNATPELNPITYGVGNHTIEYVYADSNSCVNTSSPQPITINAMPSVSLSGLNTSYTLTDPFSTLTGTPTGGVFNGTGMVSNYFDPSVAGLGTHGIAYIYVDGNGCIGSDAQCTTVDLNVNVGGNNMGTDGGTIDVYPNPSNGNFAVSVADIEGIINLSVFDSRGREVFTTAMVGNGQKTIQNIDISNYANGVYTLSIRTDKGTTTQKLVKE